MMENEINKEEEQKPEEGNTAIPNLASDETSEDNEPMTKSRIQRNVEKQSKRTIAFTIFGIISLLLLLIFYGPSLIINLSLLIGKITGSEQEVQEELTDSFIPPPVLDPIPSATNSATITVGGAASIGTQDQVKLYINDELVDVTHPEVNDTFIFTDVTLKEGENNIEAVAFKKDKKSNASNTLLVTYLKEPPELTIEHPQDGTSFSGESTLIIKGKTDPDVRVTVNGFVAITKDNGEFSYTITLQNSENKIQVVATDRAGTKTEKEVKVNYSP